MGGSGVCKKEQHARGAAHRVCFRRGGGCGWVRRWGVWEISYQIVLGWGRMGVSGPTSALGLVGAPMRCVGGRDYEHARLGLGIR